ncbi:hypothetical protein CPC08DRAFT_272712 [Agrocybe pediades]|nr:hypothetical protein CPC08DRAFT_272712 [Agrocybe pediades]
MTIILYDIPSKLPIKAWSPNTWKTRFCLNYKGLPYRTEWVEYPDIAEHAKKHGLKPTGEKNPWDGGPYYSLPAIHDEATGIYISDSWLIAEYLEKQYPDTPSVFPNNTKGLQEALGNTYDSLLDPLWNFILPLTAGRLNPRSEEYFIRTRSLAFGKPLAEVLPTGEQATTEWAQIKEIMNKVDGWFAKTDDKGPFILGDVISWADFEIAGNKIWMKVIWGEDSEQWKDVASWNGGRWENLLKALEKYSSVD